MRGVGEIARGVAPVLALLAVFIGQAATYAATDPFDAMNVERTPVPVVAPDLAFRALDGREVRLRELRGQVVLLGFFTTS